MTEIHSRAKSPTKSSAKKRAAAESEFKALADDAREVEKIEKIVFPEAPRLDEVAVRVSSVSVAFDGRRVLQNLSVAFRNKSVYGKKILQKFL